MFSLSANWMWPCNNEGEDARLYKAVEGISEFAISLGINVPTGKDSLSMKQKVQKRRSYFAWYGNHICCRALQGR